MDKYIYDENNGLWYERQGDYYIPCLTIPEEGITETLKAENQMLWAQRMNAVRETAAEIVNNDLSCV